MDRKEGKEKDYPPEYAHIEDKVKAAQERVQQLDEQIKNVPQNSKPAPRLSPPGFTQPRYFNRERAIASLEHQKADLKETTFSQVEQEVKDASPKDARLVKDNARESLYPNPFRKMSIPEKNQYNSIPKNIEQSQDLMDTFFSASPTTPPQASAEKEQETSKTEFSSMSMRFSHKLGYTKTSDKAFTSPENSRDRDVDIDQD